MEYIKVTDLKEILKDISLSNNDLGRYGDGFEQAMHLVSKRLKAINYTRCCTEFICHSCNEKKSGQNDDQLHEVCKNCFSSI